VDLFNARILVWLADIQANLEGIRAFKDVEMASKLKLLDIVDVSPQTRKNIDQAFLALDVRGSRRECRDLIFQAFWQHHAKLVKLDQQSLCLVNPPAGLSFQEGTTAVTVRSNQFSECYGRAISSDKELWVLNTACGTVDGFFDDVVIFSTARLSDAAILEICNHVMPGSTVSCVMPGPDHVNWMTFFDINILDEFGRVTAALKEQFNLKLLRGPERGPIEHVIFGVEAK
jgi:hypothetical protein